MPRSANVSFIPAWSGQSQPRLVEPRLAHRHEQRPGARGHERIEQLRRSDAPTAAPRPSRPASAHRASAHFRCSGIHQVTEHHVRDAVRGERHAAHREMQRRRSPTRTALPRSAGRAGPPALRSARDASPCERLRAPLSSNIVSAATTSRSVARRPRARQGCPCRRSRKSPPAGVRSLFRIARERRSGSPGRARDSRAAPCGRCR